MARRKLGHTTQQKLILQHLRELGVRLHEMNQKLDHLIQSCRKFYFTTDFADSSHSSNHRFRG